MSFDIFEQFATDEQLEINGVIVNLGKGATITVARQNNRAYNKLMAKLFEQRSIDLDGTDDVKEKALEEITLQVLAETVLLGWTNLSMKGEDVGDYTIEKAKKLLMIKDFREFVGGKSRQIDAYKHKKAEEIGKN